MRDGQSDWREVYQPAEAQEGPPREHAAAALSLQVDVFGDGVSGGLDAGLEPDDLDLLDENPGEPSVFLLPELVL